VAWNEDYDDPKSDVTQFNNHKPKGGEDAVVSYLRQLPRAVPAGTRWLYSTGETNLVGVLVARATKKTLSDYFSHLYAAGHLHGLAGFGYLHGADLHHDAHRAIFLSLGPILGF